METDTYVMRNWRGIIYGAVGLVTTVVGVAQSPLPWFFAAAGMIVLALLIGALRQKVVIEPTGVLLRNVFRTRRLAWADITRLEVIYSNLPIRTGWRIRLHTRDSDHDTFSLMGFGFRYFGKRFTQPPADTPEPTRLLYAILVQRLTASATSDPGSPST